MYLGYKKKKMWVHKKRKRTNKSMTKLSDNHITNNMNTLFFILFKIIVSIKSYIKKKESVIYKTQKKKNGK